MSQGKFKFSIIVPIYNVEKYLRQCLDSILSQTYSNFGSTDSCDEICEEYQAKDERIHIIHQENRGLLAARRVGIRAATGDYIIHVDSDDYCDRILLEQLCEKIIETDSDLILYDYSIVDVCGNVIKKLPVNRLPIVDGYIPKKVLINAMINTWEYNSLCMKCAKRSIVDIDEDYSKYGRLQMGEDLLQSIPLVENATRISNINISLYMYRSTVGSMSRRLQKEYIYHYLLVRKRMYKAICRYYADSQEQRIFFEKYHHGLAFYLVKSALIYSSRDYKEMIDDIKQYLVDYAVGRHYFSSVADKLCYRLGIGKHYMICRLIAFCIQRFD